GASRFRRSARPARSTFPSLFPGWTRSGRADDASRPPGSRSRPRSNGRAADDRSISGIRMGTASSSSRGEAGGSDAEVAANASLRSHVLCTVDGWWITPFGGSPVREEVPLFGAVTTMLGYARKPKAKFILRHPIKAVRIMKFRHDVKEA